jgi:Zn-dependent protease
MFRTRWDLFRLLGIPIRVSPSWLVILALLSWTLAEQFRQQLPDTGRATLWLLGLGTALGFFVCIVLHELGHAVVARRLGMPINGITLFLFGGVAEMEEEPATPLREFLMAIAGPAVSAVLAVVFLSLAWLASVQGWAKSAQLVCQNLALINLGVLIFNLVPAFPLDGGRVLRSILWGASLSLRRATHWAALVGQGFAWFLIAVGVLEMFAREVIPGMWLGLIGLFLNNAARSSY